MDDRYYVYAVELDQPWKVYVGSSALAPDVRFTQHKEGGMATSRHVRRHGKRLRPDLYTHLNPFVNRQTARAAEQSLATTLTARGYHVYGSSCHLGKAGCFGI